jgi:hypothetical protein
MKFLPISGWDEHIEAGRKYLKTASNGLSRPAIFNNELIFQLAAMGIEKIIMGVSQYHHQMPVDHTLSGLVEALNPVCPVDTGLADKIKEIETIDDICNLTTEHRTPPADADIDKILAVGKEVSLFAARYMT